MAIAGSTDWTRHFQQPIQSSEQFGITRDHLLGLIIVLLFVLGLLAYQKLARQAPKPKRQSRYQKPKTDKANTATPALGSIFKTAPQAKPSIANTPSMADPKKQMDAISRVSFESIALLNKEESRLLPILEDVVKQVDSGHRVMAQTSMGEILRPKSGSGTPPQVAAAFASINSKRLDFIVVDQSGQLACAIEYQGSGHYQGTAFMRDAVKKEVLRRADVPFVEVPAKFDPKDVTRIVYNILKPDPSGSQHRHTTVHM